MSPSQHQPTAAEARAEAEARRDEVRAERQAAFERAYGDRAPGEWVMAASWTTTVIFAVTSIVAAVAPNSIDAVYLLMSLGLFALGCVVFLAVLVLAAARSRTAEMGIGGLFFLAGSAPRSVQWNLLGSLAVQVVVSVVAAAVGFTRIGDRELNVLAFGILVPMLGLGWCGLWSVRWGLFPDRVAPR